MITRSLVLLSFFVLSSCITTAKQLNDRRPIEIVESIPLELDRQHQGTLRTDDTWLKMIESAKVSIDMSQQYADILQPPNRMKDIISALQEAGDRGVKIRVLLGNHMQKRGNQSIIESIEKLSHINNLEIRETSRWQPNNGILHSKYMIVDQKHIYLGSANFDWKALDQIAEIGVYIQQRDTGLALTKVFNDDWQHYDQEAAAQSIPVNFNEKIYWKESRGFGWYQLAISPKTKHLDEDDWDLHHLLRYIHEAKSSVRLVAMSYYNRFYRSPKKFLEIEDALIQAAKRGLRVELMLDKKKAKYRRLRRLIENGVKVQQVSIPEHSSGPINYARLMHIKLGLFDDRIAWLGSSNFGGGYFYDSRNLSIFIQSEALLESLEGIYSYYWYAPWSSPVEAEKEL